MTTLFKQGIRCSVCGTETEHTVIGSTNAGGSPDLDTRPPEAKRSTIHAWVQRCSECGVCASDLSKVDSSTGEIIGSGEYTAQLVNAEYPELANSFICKSMIDEHGGNFASATWALIHAAWGCDDAKLPAQAANCRRRAATMLRKAEANGKAVAQQPGASTTILVDLLRRSSAFAEAASVVEKAIDSLKEDILLQVLRYQKELIDAGSVECHTIAEALGKGGRSQTQTKRDDSDSPQCHPGSPKRWWQFWR